ncbi:MAG: tetratricopeptide repeat protein [Myxococcales bacterium]|nr:tetratricopeptide repeat protein [Myxococcales bacterium]
MSRGGARWPLAALGPALLLAACKPSPAGPGSLTARLLLISDDVQALTGTAAPSAESSLHALEEIAVRVRSAGGDPLLALHEVVFGEPAFGHDLRREELDLMRLPVVLAERRGTCLGLGGLYLALGERLGLTVQGVLVPGHFFVRAGQTNVELLKRGERLPDAWYRERYLVPAGGDLYLRSLGGRETEAVFRYNLANALRQRGRLREAIAVYREVVAVLPGFAEAHANLGLSLHAAGELEWAAASYELAREAHPDLPGLTANLEVLERDRASLAARLRQRPP